MPTPATQAQASQDFVPVREVRDGVILLHNGGLRAVLMASSLNFALKSEDEQNAFIMQFQSFFNSLDFTVQIYIQSRELDIRPYIATLEDAYKKTLDDLMRIQIREYIDFIKSFVEGADIMTKHFFVIVPYSPAPINLNSGLLSKMPWSAARTKTEKSQDERAEFEENVSQLDQRISVVQQGLIRTGVRTVQLDTEEVIELLYKVFNPGEQEKPVQMIKKER
jgi:type IV secretory pathway VirB4 component